MVETFPIINHCKAAIEDVLFSGNRTAIQYMFQWPDAPFKRDWFSMQYSHLEMDEEAKSYLRWLLKSDPALMNTRSLTYPNDFRVYEKGKHWP